MTKDEYTTLRPQIERLLADANEKYPLGERVGLAIAIRGLRREGKDLGETYPNMPPALYSSVYEPLVRRLDSADELCSETEIRELERLIDEGLPNP